MIDYTTKQAVVNAIDELNWYSLNGSSMVSGAKSEEDAWYKAKDVYKAINSIPFDTVKVLSDGTLCEYVEELIKVMRVLVYDENHCCMFYADEQWEGE